MAANYGPDWPAIATLLAAESGHLHMLIVVSDTTNKITGIMLSGNTSGKYTLCDIYPGMGFYTAKDAAVDFGWNYSFTSDNTVYYKGILDGTTLYLAITESSYSSTVSSVAVLTA